MIIIYNLTPCTEIYLHIVMTNYLKRSQPLFNDTYLNALISSFHHFFFFNDLSSVDDFYNILYFVVMMDMKVRKSKK